MAYPQLFEGATEAISEVGGYSVDLASETAYLVQTAEKAMLWIQLVARGTAGHGSLINSHNAVTMLADAVSRLGRHEWPLRLTRTTEELLTKVAGILGADIEKVGHEQVAIATGSASRFILATLRTTTNPTVLTAGYKHNVVPDQASALVDVRTAPGEEEATLAAIADIVGPDIEIVILHRDIGLETTLDGALAEHMTSSLRRFDPGAHVLPYMLSGGTDNKALAKLGIRGFGFAPLKLPKDFDFPSMFHGVDERVPLDALVFGRAVLTDLLRTY